MLNKMKKINESGRSMVEMLGVLAIIGVLSVMGIAGYTAAMKSYKENEIVASTSMCYMMGMAQNGGTGKNPMTCTNPPTGASTIAFGADNKVTITFSDTNLCAGVKAKFGDNAGDCSGNTLVVTLGDEEAADAVLDDTRDYNDTDIGSSCTSGYFCYEFMGSLIAACENGKFLDQIGQSVGRCTDGCNDTHLHSTKEGTCKNGNVTPTT